MTDTKTAAQAGKTDDRAHDVAGRARETASHAKHAATDAARRTAQTLESNPLGILVGGLAVGAIAGALIPRSAKEKELLAPVGRQLGERARAAVASARQAGQSELDNLGLSKSAAKDQARSIFTGLAQAVTSAGTAAAKSAASTSSSKDGAAKPQPEAAETDAFTATT